MGNLSPCHLNSNINRYATQVNTQHINIVINATGILSPHVLPVGDLRTMLLCNEETLPSTMHLLILSEDELHFYRYLHTHVLIADEQFLLLIDLPIQDDTQQLKIYEVFNLAIPRGNFSACYNINNRYLDITHDATKVWKFQKISSKHAKRLVDSFAV